MTVELQLSAPGKLVLLGEYTVLFGHPAIVVAVDRRARVTLSATRDNSFQVTAPGITDQPVRFDLTDEGTPRWIEGEGSRHMGLVASVLSSMAAAGLLEPSDIAPFSAVLDTSAFFESKASGPAKLGLGSSAALTVSLASAIARWSGHDELLQSPLEWLRALVRLHRDYQHGRGSGIDLAASLIGGVLLYQLDDGGGVLRADPISLPDDLVVRFVWTGRSADTRGYLDRLSAAMRSDHEAVRRSLDDLGAVAAAGVEALIEGRAGDFLVAADAACGGMERLGHACGMAIVSDVHRDLRRLAKQAGVAYKPSGAGGGDIGLLLTDDPDRADAAALTMRRFGYSPLDASIDPLGLA